MTAEEYLLEQLKERKLSTNNIDDCYQVLAEIMKDFTNLKLDEVASKSIEMKYDRQDTRPNNESGLVLRNFQVCYAVAKQDILKLKL